MTERELFKEAVMNYLVDDDGVKHLAVRRKTHRLARRILVAAACLLLAAGVTVTAIPSARAAVQDWISGWFDARGYFGQAREERTNEPTIESITTSAGENAATVSEVGEGYESYAAAFDMTLDEIAYDGTSIFISGTMSGETARPFVQASTGGDTFRSAKNDGSLGDDSDMAYYYFACENRVTFTTAEGKRYSGEIVPSFTPEMDAICTALINEDVPDVFENGELVSSNPKADERWDAYLADHDVRFSMELQAMQQETAPLSGLVKGELSLRMYYDNVDSLDRVTRLNATFGEIVVDADAYVPQTTTTQAQDGIRVDLRGVHPVTIYEWQPEAERTSDDCEIYYSTRELDFTGTSISLKEIAFTPTDTKITLHVVLPESWSLAERRGNGLTFFMLFDGEKRFDHPNGAFSVSGPWQIDYDADDWREFDYVFFESYLSPSEWAAVKTLTLIPTTKYWWEMEVNYDDGPYETVSLRDGAVSTGVANHTGYCYDELYDEMTQCALTIKLDDYR